MILSFEHCFIFHACGVYICILHFISPFSCSGKRFVYVTYRAWRIMKWFIWNTNSWGSSFKILRIYIIMNIWWDLGLKSSGNFRCCRLWITFWSSEWKSWFWTKCSWKYWFLLQCILGKVRLIYKWTFPFFIFWHTRNSR